MWQKICLQKAVFTLFIVVLSGCAAIDKELISDSPKLSLGVGTLVLASAETQAVGTLGLDAADDPEIWVDPKTGAAVILATDKKAGLYAFGLDGKVLDFSATGPLNNVDVRGLGGQAIIMASDRGRNGVALFSLSAGQKLNYLSTVALPTSEAYGFCLGLLDQTLTAVVVGKNGDVAVAKMRDVPVYEAPRYSAYDVTRFEVGSQSEGCVIDDKTGLLYIAEEMRGVWVYDLKQGAAMAKTRRLLASAPSPELTPDVEGLSLMRDAGKTYLIASSQGDSSFPIWELGATPVYKGRFSVGPGRGIDAVTGTDGLAAYSGPIGSYPQGIIVVQDDADTQGEALSTQRLKQNFKIIDWREVKSALEL
jgi:3-phytase